MLASAASIFAGKTLTPRGEKKVSPVTRRLAASSKDEAGEIKEDFIWNSMRSQYPPGKGNKIFLGVFQKPVEEVTGEDPAALEEKRAALRAQAAKDLTNIGADERELRKKAGLVILAFTLALDAALVANHAGFWPRLATYLPTALGASYIASGAVGICNIGQGGVWDVDGTGLQEIKDPSLAQRIRNKVNDFNVKAGAVSVAATLLFASIPL